MRRRLWIVSAAALASALAVHQGLRAADRPARPPAPAAAAPDMAMTGAAAPGMSMAAPGMAMAAAAGLPPPTMPPPPEARPDEPLARQLSSDKARQYLEAVAVNWVHQRQCGTCHTSYAYMMAAPSFGAPTVHETEVRRFFDERVHTRMSRPALPHALILAGVLSINDSQRGVLEPATREALDQAWELQDGDGGWQYPRVFYSPPLGDPYYGAVMVALGTGLAPGGYAATPAAQEGMANLRRWLAAHPAPSLHHRTVLLWASLKTPGLMTSAERDGTIAALRALQHPDGGWALSSLGDWNRRNGAPNPPNAPSDGYATALVTYVLQQAGLPAKDRSVAGGVAWLKSNQRQSGRWFTYSINTDDKGHLISNIGTAYAVMALRAAGELPPAKVAAR